MNTNMTLTCVVCGEDTDCRLGYSNRKLQPLSFACPHCASQMYITLDASSPPASNFDYEGCRLADNQKRPFSGENPFVDLHLDFPVRFGEYIMGQTPFLMAMQAICAASDSEALAMAKLQFHNDRLNQLNYFADRAGEVKTIIRLYLGKNKQLFKKRVATFLGIEINDSLKPQDVNAALYQFLTFVFRPFVDFGEVKNVVENFGDLTVRLAGAPFNAFIREMVDSGFLGTLQADCLKLYPKIYEAELPLRPAFYLDLLESQETAKSPARISTQDFQSYKDLYKDILEVFSRQLVLLAGINNVIHRQNHNAFATISGGTLSSLEKFSGKTLGDRFKYLDDCWYKVDQDVIDAGVRNSIAHNNVDYDEVTQIVRYFPNGGGIAQAPAQEMYFLDFMRIILLAFREMNNLHHLIKCLFYYEYLVLKNPKRSE